jgi:hypothetical protein
MIDAAASQIDELYERVRELELALRSIAEVPLRKEIPDRTTMWGLAVHMQETALDALKGGKHD